jgi:hypothetical protein
MKGINAKNLYIEERECKGITYVVRVTRKRNKMDYEYEGKEKRTVNVLTLSEHASILESDGLFTYNKFLNSRTRDVYLAGAKVNLEYAYKHFVENKIVSSKELEQAAKLYDHLKRVMKVVGED